jgi:CrcB protein
MASSAGFYEWLVIALGGAIGALLRFEIGHRLRVRFGEPVLATFGVNLTGCFLAGALLGAAGRWDATLATFVMAGVLGSYTTVSALSLETATLWQSGRRLASGAYLLAMLVGGIVSAVAGRTLMAGPPG